MRLSLLTLVRNRNGYLRNLIRGLAASTMPPLELVVVRAGGEDPRTVVSAQLPFRVRVLEVSSPTDRIPYATARNTAARAAQGEAIVFIDADCIPSATFAERITAALRREDALCIGDVLYLPPDAAKGEWTEAALQQVGRPHPAREASPRSGVTASERYALVWGLCMALRRSTFFRLGGFDERYGGYAGEDTDLAFTAKAAGVPLRLVAGADVFHQHHDVFEPPLQQFEATLANARHFHAKWGWWPMEGWLQRFAALGLIHWDTGAADVRIERLPTPEEVEAARFETAAALRA